MNLETFLEKHDRENGLVLLGGKRKVDEAFKDRCIQLGALLAKKTKVLKFRTGNADGADALFAQGVASIDSSRLQSVIPYQGHRRKSNLAYDTWSLDHLDLALEPEIVYQSKADASMARLVDQYVQGERHRFAQKAAYILRDTWMVLGNEELSAASIGLFYDDLLNPRQGGTGHTMNTCSRNGVPVIDQRTWLAWIDHGDS